MCGQLQLGAQSSASRSGWDDLPLRPNLGMSSSRRTTTPWSLGRSLFDFARTCCTCTCTCMCTSETALALALPLLYANGCASLRRHARHVGDLLAKGAAIVVGVGLGGPGGLAEGRAVVLFGRFAESPSQNFQTGRDLKLGG